MEPQNSAIPNGFPLHHAQKGPPQKNLSSGPCVFVTQCHLEFCSWIPMSFFGESTSFRWRDFWVEHRFDRGCMSTTFELGLLEINFLAILESAESRSTSLGFFETTGRARTIGNAKGTNQKKMGGSQNTTSKMIWGQAGRRQTSGFSALYS